MKQLLLSLMLLPVLSYGQSRTYTMADMPYFIDSTTGGVVYRGVVELPGVKQDDLYVRAKSWMFKAFTNAKEVIQIDDKAGGLLAGKGYLRPSSNTASILLTGSGFYYQVPIEIRIKDGKYRYEIANIEAISGSTRVNMDYYTRKAMDRLGDKPITEKQYEKYIKATTPFTDLINSLKQAMQQKAGKEDF